MEKTELTNAQKQNRVRQRISQASIDPDKYEYIPAKEQNDHVKADQYQRVAIYARVSTDNPMQTTSFELQQKYYEELVAQHPQWVLVKIYADEGKSGTTMQHRDGFNEMLADADAGKIDLIIVKNISRFARNVVDCLSIIRKLSEKKIGVLFESEAIYSLNDDSHMALSFQATIAEQESRTRSRSMETSLRMRLDHGLPLTPELLGFVKNEDGKRLRLLRWLISMAMHTTMPSRAAAPNTSSPSSKAWALKSVFSFSVAVFRASSTASPLLVDIVAPESASSALCAARFWISCLILSRMSTTAYC